MAAITLGFKSVCVWLLLIILNIININYNMWHNGWCNDCTSYFACFGWDSDQLLTLVGAMTVR